jgi:hypothetical protein
MKPRNALATLVLGLGCLLVAPMGCESEPVGHSKTVQKKTIDTPTEKTTVTETKEKDTRIDPHN